MDFRVFRIRFFDPFCFLPMVNHRHQIIIWVVTKTLAICCICCRGLHYPVIEIVISHFKDSYESISIMECQPRVKVLMYRDQCSMDWKEVVPKPIKAVLRMLECLQVCDQPSCTCNKWHRDTHDVDPIIDLWQRDFVSLHFQKTKPDQAAIFTCFMRIAKVGLPIVIAQSGQDGIYVEPRPSKMEKRSMMHITQYGWTSKHMRKPGHCKQPQACWFRWSESLTGMVWGLKRSMGLNFINYSSRILPSFPVEKRFHMW